MTDILHYGPTLPEEDHSYSANITTPPYLRGYANKMIRDLEKAARMYNGKKVRLFKLTGTERCTKCTNSITGEILHSNCPECNGTGKRNSWTYIGQFWAYVDFGPGMDMVTENGRTINPGGQRQPITIIGAPEIFSQDFIVFDETKEVYKVFDVEPQLMAVGGIIVSQTLQGSLIDYGSPEYRVVTW